MNAGAIPSLDGLRALSIGLVVLGHSWYLWQELFMNPFSDAPDL
jgi:peptidoglycan/LPS O-acetylase OafA/YrhL